MDEKNKKDNQIPDVCFKLKTTNVLIELTVMKKKCGIGKIIPVGPEVNV